MRRGIVITDMACVVLVVECLSLSEGPEPVLDLIAAGAVPLVVMPSP